MRHPSKGIPPSLMFAPFIADNPDGSQTLVQIFVDTKDDDGTFTIESVWTCYRTDADDQWSTPIRTRRP